MAGNRKGQKLSEKDGQQNGQKKSTQSSGNKSNQKCHSEFKFQPHDTATKNGYTFEKIQESAIFKLQTNLEYGRYVVKSLRDRVKQGPADPQLETSTAGAGPTDQARIVEQNKFNHKYRVKMDHWLKRDKDFSENWEHAYGIIFGQYCSSTMQLVIKEQSDFETRICDNPLELLIKIEKIIYVPMRLVYLVLTLILFYIILYLILPCSWGAPGGQAWSLSGPCRHVATLRCS